MASITFIVSDSAQSPAREDTLQVFDMPQGGAIVISQFTAPTSAFNRSYAASMDYNSGRGTKVSKHQRSMIGITYPIALLPAVEELVDSLADYQIASLDASDIDFMGSTRNFRMMGNDFPREAVGCTHLSLSMELLYLP